MFHIDGKKQKCYDSEIRALIALHHPFLWFQKCFNNTVSWSNLTTKYDISLRYQSLYAVIIIENSHVDTQRKYKI